jgi:hypothetical protein
LTEPLFMVGTLEAAPLPTEDAEALRELFASCEGNEDLACGLPSDSSDDPRDFSPHPAGDVVSIGVFEGEDTAGIIDVARDTPTTGVWTVGLLMVETGRRGSVLGHEVLIELGRWAASQGATRLRVGAPEHTEAFWLEAGFEPASLDDDGDAVRDGFVMLERELGPATPA